MGLSRSTFDDAAPATLDGGEILARIGAICDEFECYGYRRVGAALRHQVYKSALDLSGSVRFCGTGRRL
jgi:hypothetical protein